MIPKQIVWQNAPDEQTIRDAYGTYTSIRAHDPYICLHLPELSRTAFARMVADTPVQSIDIATLIAWDVDNQPVRDRPVQDMKTVSEFWKDGRDDIQVLENLNKAESLPPPIFLHTPQYFLINLDGAHRCTLASLRRSALSVCIVDLSAKVLPPLSLPVWVRNDIEQTLVHEQILHRKPTTVCTQVVVVSMRLFELTEPLSLLLLAQDVCNNGGLIIGRKQLLDAIKAIHTKKKSP